MLYQPIIKQQGDQLIVGSSQDCTAIIERAEALQKAGAHGSKDFKHAAKIPFVVIETYANTRGLEISDVLNGSHHIKAMLNDPALSRLRIWKGKV